MESGIIVVATYILGVQSIARQKLELVERHASCRGAFSSCTPANAADV